MSTSGGGFGIAGIDSCCRGAELVTLLFPWPPKRVLGGVSCWVRYIGPSAGRCFSLFHDPCLFFLDALQRYKTKPMSARRIIPPTVPPAIAKSRVVDDPLLLCSGNFAPVALGSVSAMDVAEAGAVTARDVTAGRDVAVDVEGLLGLSLLSSYYENRNQLFILIPWKKYILGLATMVGER